MIQKCENCKENGKTLIKNARKSKFGKTCQSKYGYVIPNCCQISFRKRR